MSLLIYEDQFLRLSISPFLPSLRFFLLFSAFFLLFRCRHFASFPIAALCLTQVTFFASRRDVRLIYLLYNAKISSFITVSGYQQKIAAANWRRSKLAREWHPLSLAALLNFVLSLSLSLPSRRELISLLMTLLYLMLILFSTQIIYFHKNMYPFIQRAYTFTFVSLFSLSHKKNVWNLLSISPRRPSPVFA